MVFVSHNDDVSPQSL